MAKEKTRRESACNKPGVAEMALAMKDTLNVLSGKWKLPIIGSLIHGEKRFNELDKEIEAITPRMLSKELKDLEMNGIVKRTVYDTLPVSVYYELTNAGKTLDKVIYPMIAWGMQHRKNTMKK